MNIFVTKQQILKMVHGYVLQLTIFGETADNGFSLTYGYLTHMPCLIVTSPQCSAISRMSKRRSGRMKKVREIEHGSFAPLVFSISGGMGSIATTVYKIMASLIAEKHHHPYSSTLLWLRCKLSFSLLQSAIMCIRGSRTIMCPFVICVFIIIKNKSTTRNHPNVSKGVHGL